MEQTREEYILINAKAINLKLKAGETITVSGKDYSVPNMIDNHLGGFNVKEDNLDEVFNILCEAAKGSLDSDSLGKLILKSLKEMIFNEAIKISEHETLVIEKERLSGLLKSKTRTF